MIAPAANKSVPKSDREKKRLVSETLRNARTEGDHLTERVREFPEEALDSLFALLSPKDLISAAATCRKWRAAGVITLQSRLKRSLHRINVLSSNPTSNEVKQCLLEMGTLISDTSVRLQETPLSQFDLVSQTIFNEFPIDCNIANRTYCRLKRCSLYCVIKWMMSSSTFGNIFTNNFRSSTRSN